MGTILGISLIHGYDPWDFFGSFLDPYDFDPWISLVHSLVLMGTTLGISLVTLGISWSYDIFSIWPRCIFDLKSFNCSFLDPDGFDPWISLVHSLILDSILGVSLVCSLIMMGTILGISLIHGYDPWDFFGSFLDPYDFDPWISLVHSLVLMGTTLGISLVTLGISWISLI